MTYGKGAFWKNVDTSKYDFRPSDILTGTDFCDLPYEAYSTDALLLDPPYMHGPYGSTKHAYTQNLDDAYHNNNGSHESVIRLYAGGIREAARVLRKGGIIIIKCQDETVSGKQRLSHVEIINLLESFGFEFIDLFVLLQSGTPCLQVKEQKSARKNHSYALIGRLRTNDYSRVNNTRGRPEVAITDMPVPCIKEMHTNKTSTDAGSDGPAIAARKDFMAVPVVTPISTDLVVTRQMSPNPEIVPAFKSVSDLLAAYRTTDAAVVKLATKFGGKLGEAKSVQDELVPHMAYMQSLLSKQGDNHHLVIEARNSGEDIPWWTDYYALYEDRLWESIRTMQRRIAAYKNDPTETNDPLTKTQNAVVQALVAQQIKKKDAVSFVKQAKGEDFDSLFKSAMRIRSRLPEPAPETTTTTTAAPEPTNPLAEENRLLKEQLAALQAQNADLPEPECNSDRTTGGTGSSPGAAFLAGAGGSDSPGRTGD